MHISRIFAELAFDERTMKKYLPLGTYIQLKRCIANNLPIPLNVANKVANAMKKWAIKRGATHYTHWFQPLAGTSAQKHESFITPTKTGKVIMSLSGKELVKGEADASSFANGNLRSTCQARGYTTWDPTSHAFIKDGVLCIPALFFSYDGNALDKKIPLIRSIQAIDKQCVRLLSLLGKKVEHIKVEVGAEQEYFLIDSDVFQNRKDLRYTGRTLFGAMPKRQEFSDHYFCSISPKVAEFMQELDDQLWKIGILAKTKHSENAPCQYEFAPVFTTVNLAVDQNQLTMELMKKVAKKHHLTCLLHEKPFQGVNGSGKHNNWSISTKNGNLLDMGDNPQSNASFLLILCGVICGVDEHQDLIRGAVASASNDLRLGSSEAPPPIISIYLGDELTSILQAVAQSRTLTPKEQNIVQIGLDFLPKFPKDLSDRNRTSPIAFNGNKFEFRMCGSSQSLADINTVINTILAEQFEKFADILEQCEDINSGVKQIVESTMRLHGRIIFNGDNYSPLWQKEARKRGLLSIKSSPKALAYLTDKKSVELFEKQKVLSFSELKARQTVGMQEYCSRIRLEAETMLDIAKTDMLPALSAYKCNMAKSAKNCSESGVDNTHELAVCKTLSALAKSIKKACSTLSSALERAQYFEDNFGRAKHYHASVIPAMNRLRQACDTLELHMPKALWTMPSCCDILLYEE